jgi:two-component system, cell cycle sensor histidine kinase and response regulator CckA
MLSFTHRDSETPTGAPMPSQIIFQKVDLNSFLQAQEPVFRDLLGPSVNLRYSLATNAPEISANPELLTELISIFLSNSKKAMPLGGQLLLQTREVTMPESETFPGGAATSYLMLAISDSGEGVPPETQMRIQQLFAGRWRPQGRFMPGLVRAKAILDAHHARLLLFSQMIRATTFKLYFPIKKSDSATPTSSPSVAKGTETLLFVEDDAMIRQIYTKYLRQRGYNVLEAQHGKEAFGVYENYTGHIDLMITDVVMPELNGRQLVDLVSLRHPQLKVLYISGFTKDAIVQRGILGAEMPFLEKPFGREELALRIRQLLDSRS